jgi:hypothetical protein
MAPPFTVRPAAPADAPAIAHVHGTSWRETYTGLMPVDFLTRMTDDAARERRTANWLRDAADPAQVVLVAEQAGEVVAFASAGPPRDHPGVDAELYTLYLYFGEFHGPLNNAVQHEQNRAKSGRRASPATSMRMAGTVSPNRPSGWESLNSCKNRRATKHNTA